MEFIARTPKQIGEALRNQRRMRNVTQANLGEMTQLRQATISTVEAGEPGTQLGTICDLLAVLDLEFVIRPRTKADKKLFEEIF